MKAVIYVRCSSSGNQELRQDVGRQISDLSQYCNYQGYEIVKIFEEHLTAKNGTNRPVLNDCVSYMKGNHVDILVVSELSRINRGSVFDTMAFVKELMDAGINLYTQKEQFTLLDNDGKPSIFAPVLLSCLSLAYSIELESIKFRLQSGRAEAIRKGVKMGRKEGSIKTLDQLASEYGPVIKSLKRGQTIRNTAKICGVSVSTVQRVKKAFNL